MLKHKISPHSSLSLLCYFCIFWMRIFSLLVKEGTLFRSMNLCVDAVTPAAVIQLLEVPLFSHHVMLVLVGQKIPSTKWKLLDMNSNWDDAGSIVIYSSHVTQVLSCWKVFYRVKENRRLPKFQKQHFCYPEAAWFSKCNQEDFGLPHLTCQDTEIMSLSSSCMGPPDQGGCHLSRMHCHLRHDPPPLTILHEPTARDSPAHTKVVALSVSPETSEEIVVVWWFITQPQGLSLLLDSFMNLAVSVSYICTKPRVQGRGSCGHNLPFSHGIKCIHIFYLCYVILFLTSTWAGWWQDG